MSDTVIVIESTSPQVSVNISNAQGPQGQQGAQGLVPVFTRQNDLSVVTGKTRFYFEESRTITKIRASVGTVPTGSGVTVDTLVNNVSIGTITIPAGQNTATLAVAKSVVAGDYATVSILSVGSTTPGTDLTLILTIN
jgi:hypothetical protein